jgi:hypothetical protein
MRTFIVDASRRLALQRAHRLLAPFNTPFSQIRAVRNP